jgi:hypothetical protein
MSKRILAAIIAAALLIPSAACSQSGDPSDTIAAGTSETSSSTTSEPAEQTETGRADIKDSLPDYNWEGREYRVAQNTNVGYEFFVEDMTGEATNDAVYNRNIAIEERFNVKIVPTNFSSGSETINQTSTAILAGENAWDIVSHLAYMSYSPISKGVYQNWLDVNYVDFTAPWWNKLANDTCTFNGIAYTATGDINVTALLFTYGMFFNMRLTEENGMTASSLYNAVYDGKWTIDYFISLCSDIYTDVNGDGEKDKGDIFGYVAHPGISSDAWLAAFDQPISGKDENGLPTPKFMTDKTVSALEKISDFYYNKTGTLAPAEAEGEVPMFADGKVVFVPSIFNDAFNTYRYMDDAYGILPYPKWDEAQKNYLTNARDQYTVLCVPKTVEDTDFVGMITEALAAESYRYVYPAYYDIALKGKYSEDADTANMIDIIMKGRSFDFSYLFGEANFVRLPYLFRDMLMNKQTDVASKYAKSEKALLKNVEKIADYYTAD